jgi:plastocyanin
MRSRLLKSAPLVALALLGLVAAGCGSGAQPLLSEGAVDRATHHPPARPAPSHTRDVSTRGAPAGPVGTVAHDRPNQVAIDNFSFHPARLTVPVGTKVTWINRDDVPHTATDTARPRAFSSGALDTDDTFTHVFTAAGVYKYFCAVHPNMIGEIIVK